MAQQDPVDIAIAALEDVRQHEESLRKKAEEFPHPTKPARDLKAAVENIYGLRTGQAQHKSTDLVKVSTLSAAQIKMIADTWKNITNEAVNESRKRRLHSWSAGEIVGCASTRVTLGKRTQWHGEPWVACQLGRDATQPCFRNGAGMKYFVVLPGSKKKAEKGEEFHYF
ncbi:uncharacterized protein MYCFIDRAFT_82272 [Pseudocercospora fijiensis CIRAD86]|uniref:Uncharacterized protein n=1 Tax=Pseudocercospora fijiensis (strain CIRAD86) TaxID=383855 RepID=M3AYV4_PSEFD|nr:uncharacterized protein MYCFIDRAFT_82272 [Pseudocercospora fijiensis CIRAD86]EME82348.1 hypothetical protein MYCFIDRAFT_82272 [Pseudocercospora fijiensis CIRAD86]